MSVNDNLVLVCGKSACGKSASLMQIDKPEGVLYLNCEAGKKLPFRSKFKQVTVTDPLQVYSAFDQAEKADSIHTIVVDSLTYLMDMYESNYVINSANTMQAWGDYAQFFRTLMMKYVATSTKNVIFTAHLTDQLNESEHVMETFVPIKGSTKKNGVESYFSTVVTAKKVPLTKLEGYGSGLLNITAEEEALGFKYVYQTRITKDTVNERVRGPLGLWTTAETYIDNSAQTVLNQLSDYYKEDEAA